MTKQKEEFIFRSKLPDIDIPKGLPLHSYVFENFSKYPSKPCLINGANGDIYTYADVEFTARRVASGLNKLGIHRGDVIMLILPSSPEFVLAFLGASHRGAITTAANPFSTPAELAKQARASKAKLLITQACYYDKVKDYAQENDVKVVCVDSAPDECLHFSELTQANENDMPRAEFSPDDVVALPYSSGTTGLPKGVMLTHKGLITSVAQLVDGDNPNLYFHSGDVILCVLPMFHIYAMHSIMLCGLRVGAAILIMPKFEIGSVLGLIGKYKVSIAPVVPPVILAIARSPDLDKHDLSSLRMLKCGGSPLGKELEDTVRAKFPQARLGQGYGMTEAGPVLAMCLAFAKEPFDIKPGACGTVVRNAEMKIVDPETGASLPRNQPGEICIRGDQIMKGYLNDPEATSRTIDNEGWLHTGDIGYIDDDDELFIVDRLKELIKYNSFQVAPAELEALLQAHPGISDAAVVGMKDEKAGEIPVAFVMKSENSQITEEEIMQYISKQVIYYKRIRRVFFVEVIPKAPSGKILRKNLKERLAAGDHIILAVNLHSTHFRTATSDKKKMQNRALQEKETKNQRHPETMRFQRGDVVWARVIYPQTWYPGLVSTTDTLGIFVSFFNIIKPRYVVESEVLVDHVLKFIARRAVSSLKCPFGLVSQVQMLRRFMVTHQKFLLNEDGIKKKHNKDDCICLSASGNAAQLVTQKSVTSELEVESLREDQPSELLTQTKQTKPQPLTEMPVNLHCLAPNAFFMSECLNTVKQSCLRFGNLSYPSTSNLELRKLFCRSGGVRFSYPECIRSQPSVEVDGKAGKEIFAPLAPDVANPINFPGVKRQNDQPADSGFSFKLLKSTPLFSISKTDAYHQKRRPELRVHISDNLIPVPAFLDSICNTRALLSSTGGDAHLQSRTRFVTGAEIQDLHSMHLVQNIPHVYLAKDASYCSNILERSMFLENKDNVALNDNGTCLPVSEMQEPGGITSIVKDCEALKPVDYDAVENIAEGILSEDQMDDHKLVLKLSTTMPVINCVVETSGLSFKPQLAQQSVLGACANSKTYSDNDKTVNAIAATSIYLPYEPNTDQIQMKPSNSEDAISFGTSRRMSIISSLGGSLMNNECYLPGTFDPLVKPRLTERPAIGPSSSSIIYSEKDDNGNARAATSNCFPCKLNIDQSQLEHGDYDSATSVETSIGVSMISSFEGSSIDDKGHCRPDTTDLSFNPQVAEQSAVGAFDNIKTRSGNEKIGNCLSSELNTLRVLIQPCNSDNATSVETSRSVSMVSSSEGISMNNKERNIQGISEQPFKSKVSQQPAESTFTYSNSLQMKFPKDFILPSKMDLIRKFSRFGRVDPLKTEVFQLMGSAQVVFFDELDAVAAYQYAKRKNNLYGVATVLYWLDRSGQKRRGSNFLSPPSSSNLKSSLKKSSRRGKEDNKHTRRVRFRIET
ncbi:hypothetical protein SADUNF_Sadunf03G0144800 [Salix dunnii]|uniref:4-coumarate--CoA ligase n=3 Tax=Saliceae TaxID=238069 RepID=A0A835N4V4_9ROSI|nr:hypothetical protein SADUNF_Sadunf03G0144800 [Salix dunnii]